MKRESGWYWVKNYWMPYAFPRYYDSGTNLWHSNIEFLPDCFWEIIYPERIKSPEEK